MYVACTSCVSEDKCMCSSGYFFLAWDGITFLDGGDPQCVNLVLNMESVHASDAMTTLLLLCWVCDTIVCCASHSRSRCACLHATSQHVLEFWLDYLDRSSV